ncbi:MAG: NAD-dependent epimerase/dehydratase family protein [Elusimicrobia bacterium]|nr:NAD-dependent epimerase/dehydratase family protein [Elusimicrobiota bacterium]
MRILITGGAGFLGSHLCDRLIAEKHSVICIDNLSTGRKENIDHLAGNDKFMFIKHDVTNYLHVTGKVDAVLHFASPASPIDYLEMPIPTLKVGALGTHKALGLAKEKKALFMLASTSEVYGDPQVNPQPESYWGHVNPIGPRGVYDEAKRFAEAMTMAYHNYHNIPVRIVRIFNTYGERMRRNDGRAVPTFINQALQNRALTVFGDGTQTRSLCYVSDLIDGIIRLLHANINQPVNIGNPDEMTIKEIAELIIRLSGSKSTIKHKSLPKDDPHVRRPDIGQARRKLKWKPKISVEDGLTKTIQWFKKQPKPR